jgi:CRP-like cAMP-binding protein
MSNDTSGPVETLRFIDEQLVLNRLLVALPASDFNRIVPTLSSFPSAARQVLQEHGKPIESVFFPNGCVASMTTLMEDGGMVEVATIGREGMVNVTALFLDRAAVGEVMVQVPNGVIFGMPVKAFRDEIDRGGPFRDLVNRYAQAFLFQSMRATACNALHQLEHRCARWLLETRDRVGADEFSLSHEFLSIMLGVHRPTVTVALGTLHRAGFINSRRGTIRVVNAYGLEQASCECYRAIRTHFESVGLYPVLANGKVSDRREERDTVG